MRSRFTRSIQLSYNNDIATRTSVQQGNIQGSVATVRLGMNPGKLVKVGLGSVVMTDNAYNIKGLVTYARVGIEFYDSYNISGSSNVVKGYALTQFAGSSYFGKSPDVWNITLNQQKEVEMNIDGMVAFNVKYVSFGSFNPGSLAAGDRILFDLIFTFEKTGKLGSL